MSASTRFRETSFPVYLTDSVTIFLVSNDALGIAVGRYKEFKTLEGDLKDEHIGTAPDWTLSTSIRYQLPTKELFDGLLGPMAVQVDYSRYENWAVGEGRPAVVGVNAPRLRGVSSMGWHSPVDR